MVSHTAPPRSAERPSVMVCAARARGARVRRSQSFFLAPSGSWLQRTPALADSKSNSRQPEPSCCSSDSVEVPLVQHSTEARLAPSPAVGLAGLARSALSTARDLLCGSRSSPALRLSTYAHTSQSASNTSAAASLVDDALAAAQLLLHKLSEAGSQLAHNTWPSAREGLPPQAFATAALLPALRTDVISVVDIETWLGRGCATLAREVLLVQRTALEAVTEDAGMLVDWCLANCTMPAVVLATVWWNQWPTSNQRQASAFFILLAQRLGLESLVPPQVPALACGPAVQGRSRLIPRVLCSSVGVGSASSRSPVQSSLSSLDLLQGETLADDALVLDEAPVAAQRVSEGGATGSRWSKPVDDSSRVHVNGAATSNGANGAAPPGNGRVKQRPSLDGPLEASASSRHTANQLEPSATATADSLPTAPSASSASLEQPQEALLRPNPASAAQKSRSNPPSGRVQRGRGRSKGGSLGSMGSMGSLDEVSLLLEPVSSAEQGSASPVASAPLLQRPARPDVPADVLQPTGNSEVAQAQEGSASAEPASLPELDRLPSQGYVPMQLVPLGSTLLADPDAWRSGRPAQSEEQQQQQQQSSASASAMTIPRVGPLLLSNSPRAYPGTDAVFQLGPGEGRGHQQGGQPCLAVRLEYVLDKETGDETLQLFNLSRTMRGRVADSTVYVSGRPVGVGDAGLVLSPGDEVVLGPNGCVSFRVDAAPAPPSHVTEAMRLYCPQQTQAPVADQETASQQQQQFPSISQLANLGRREPARAAVILRRMAAQQPDNAAVWLLWAQAFARLGNATAARRLFRAAVQAAASSPVGSPLPAALAGSARRSLGLMGMTSTYSDDDDSDSASTSMNGDRGNEQLLFSQQAGQQQRRPQSQHNWLLVQALGNWAKFEWKLRYYGSARHLFRSAIDESARHPQGVAGGGGAPLLQYWAMQEFDRSNIRNSRIIVAEALRKCPDDVALYVLAASIELEGGPLELAKAFCAKAYELDRSYKHLYTVWPRVCAGLGDRIKARLLYERGLDRHPLNTKILKLYAGFEVEEGNYRQARELYSRCLDIDPLSPGPGMSVRCAWASLEASLGNTRLAMKLMEEGLAVHPDHPLGLLTLARVCRLDGRHRDALEALTCASRTTHSFDEELARERASILRALGEEELAAGLTRHLAAQAKLKAMKRQGYWGSEAWRAYYEDAASPEARKVIRAARARKKQLGWLPTERGGKPPPAGSPGTHPPGTGRRHTTAQEEQWRAQAELQQQQREVRARAAAAARAARAALAGASGSADDGDGNGWRGDGSGSDYEDDADYVSGVSHDSYDDSSYAMPPPEAAPVFLGSTRSPLRRRRANADAEGADAIMLEAHGEDGDDDDDDDQPLGVPVIANKRAAPRVIRGEDDKLQE